MIFKTNENGIQGVQSIKDVFSEDNNVIIEPKTLVTDFPKKVLIFGGVFASGTLLLITYYTPITTPYLLAVSLFLFSFLYIFWLK